MNVTETAVDGLKREFLIQIGAADIDADVQSRLQTLSKKIRMPGFRPGKVPVNLIAKTHGDAVYGEVLQEKVNASLKSTLDERKLRPAVEPKVAVTKAGRGEDLEFTLAVEVLPEIDPGNIAAITIDKLVSPVEETEVEAMIDGFIRSRREFELAEGKAAETGDVVTIDFIGRTDGEAFEGGTASGFDLELGSGRFVPGFEEQLGGAKAGDKVEVKVTFPADYAAELAGKDAVFETTVTAVKVGKAVAIDDEFAKGFGIDTVEEFKTALREQLDKQHGQWSRQRMKRDLLDELAKLHDFPVPQGLITIEIDQIIRSMGDEAKPAEGQAPEARRAELEAEYRQIAERRVRLGLLLAEIGRRSKIDVTQDEVRRAIMEEARRYPGQERQVIEFYTKNEGAMAQLRAPIYEDKVVDLLLEQVQKNERQVSLDELKRDPDDEVDQAA